MLGRTSERYLQYVTFQVDKQLFGLDIHVVKEVNTSIEITPVPLSRSSYRGLVNIRGQIVLVIDVSIVLGRQPTALSADSRLIILKIDQEIASLKSANRDYKAAGFGDKPVALLVDKIGDVCTIGKSAAEAPPAHLSQRAAELVERVANLGEQVLTVLKPEAVLAACE